MTLTALVGMDQGSDEVSATEPGDDLCDYFQGEFHAQRPGHMVGHDLTRGHVPHHDRDVGPLSLAAVQVCNVRTKCSIK